MNGTALLTIVTLTALWPPWPFGRDHEKEPDSTGTIIDLRRQVVNVDTSASIDGSIEKAIESYRLFLDLASDDPVLVAEAMRRLADLQLEYEEAVELQRNVAGVGSNFNGTIGLYEQLLESHPEYTKNDLVLYQLARAYEISGEIELALATLTRLVEEYPDTPHLAEAHFRRGETLFVEQRYFEAEQAYAAVLEYGLEGNYAEQSLYKLGWSHFKQAQHEQALEPLFGLLDRRFDHAGPTAIDPAASYMGMGRAEQELVDDSLRVLSISFSYLDGPQSISDHFNSVGPRRYSYVVYTNLGDLYLEQERFQDAADAYSAFVNLDPYHEKAPLLQVEVLEAYKQGGFADLVLAAKRDFVERYGSGSPYWESYTFEDQPEVVAHLKSNITDLAAFHHAEAQENGDRESYAQAARWYRSLLASFPDSVEAPSTNFLLSEVLFESGDYQAAAIEYERTAYAYPDHESSSEAGYAALLAYREHEATLPTAAAAMWHRQGIDSALRFAATYRDHDQVPAVQTDTAERLFALNEFGLARDVATAALAFPERLEPALTRTALAVVAHSEFDLENFGAAESAYSQLTTIIPPGDPEAGEISERIASSIYKQGELAQLTGDVDLAVNHYLRVGRSVPNSPIRATAEYDAAAALIQAGDWTRATSVLENFRAAHPDHELVSQVSANLAVAYVETGDNIGAAAEFERIADGDGSEDVRKEALWRAAELYDDSGQTASARSVFARYVERHPRPVAQSIEARQRLAEIAAGRGESSNESEWLVAIIDADARAGAERTDRTRFLAEKAQLQLAEPARTAFEASHLVAPLANSLSLKRQRMEVALDAYGRAAEYGVAEVTTAATFRIAELYHNLSRALFDSERPAELTETELEQYDILLEEQAFPFEEEAIDLHAVNAARVAEGVYDDWVKESLLALAELMPGRYAKYERGERFVSAIE
jgi:TolA-binding protein